MARDSQRRRWMAWLGAVVIAVANGALRETTYGRRLGERAAHDVSGVTGVAAFAAYFRWLQRRWPIPSSSDALAIGGQWLAMSVAFEFAFGRLVERQSWEELLAAYDVRKGSTWPLVLAWIAAGPELTRRLQDGG